MRLEIQQTSGVRFETTSSKPSPAAKSNQVEGSGVLAIKPLPVESGATWTSVKCNAGSPTISPNRIALAEPPSSTLKLLLRDGKLTKSALLAAVGPSLVVVTSPRSEIKGVIVADPPPDRVAVMVKVAPKIKLLRALDPLE